MRTNPKPSFKAPYAAVRKAALAGPAQIFSRSCERKKSFAAGHPSSHPKLKNRRLRPPVLLSTTREIWSGQQDSNLRPEVPKTSANLIAIETASMASGIAFSWEFDGTNTIDARHIVSDAGWKISLDRVLDIFQKFEMNDAFNIGYRLQVHRQVKGFEITYLQTEINL